MLRRSQRLISSQLLRKNKVELKDGRMNIHMTPKNRNPLIYGGLAIAIGAIGLQYGLKIYNSLPQEPLNSTSTQDQDPVISDSKKRGVEEEELKKSTSFTKESYAEKEPHKTDAKADTTTTAKTNNDKSEKSFFDGWFEKTYYEGGFEDKMSRREAALILGVRESSSAERIKEAHRRILLLNHPDRGGSAYMAAKINEAKDLLLKGK